MGEVIHKVSEAFGNDAIMVTDVGQHQMMAARYFKFKQSRSVVTSGGLGTMGFGLPAAIGAKIGKPDRPVVSVRRRRWFSKWTITRTMHNFSNSEYFQ